jgi:hypothetical protein
MKEDQDLLLIISQIANFHSKKVYAITNEVSRSTLKELEQKRRKILVYKDNK